VKAAPAPRKRNDLSIYDRHADDWWNERSYFAKSLHGLNDVRLREIADEIGSDLTGLTIIDLGCGGGLLSEPLARRGANVIGIDISAASIAIARTHGRGVPGLNYVQGDARQPPLPAGGADVVLCADILEHVSQWPEVIKSAFHLLRPGGRCYCSTLNRSWFSALMAVHLSEGLGLVPRGTHDPAMCIRPDELESTARQFGFTPGNRLGHRVRIWQTLKQWRICMARGNSTAISYGAWLVRPLESAS